MTAISLPGMEQQYEEKDARNRVRALELTSFIVEAPAGAGKTELLTQRYLRLLETVESPEEIIAITFTNKAAAEMRSRILDSLLMASSQEFPVEPHKQVTYDLSVRALRHGQDRDWHLLENPSRLCIFTIDSLCAHLVRQMPLMSRFGAMPGVTEDADILYEQAAEQTLALLENATHGAVIKTALRYVDNNANQLVGLLSGMLEKRDQWLHHSQEEVVPDQLQSTLSYFITQELHCVAQTISTQLQQALMPIARYAASELPHEHSMALLLDWDVPIPPDVESLAVWRALADFLLTKEGLWRKESGLTKSNGFPATDDGRAKKQEFSAAIASLSEADALVLHRVRQLPNLDSSADSWEMISSLSRLLHLAVAELLLVFQRAGEVDFVEISQRAITALSDEVGNPTDLALKLDYKIQHLLVDEFQDTSPSQIELLEHLTLGWQVDDGRTLFVVGDPMQSIYRFRKADVGLFIHAEQNGIGDIALERLQLYHNNRSCPKVVDWINTTFKELFPQADAVTQGAIAYRSFIASKPDLSRAGVEVHPIVKTVDVSQEQAMEQEATTIVEIIKQERAENHEKKIAVLVRSKKHLATLVSQLRRAHSEIKFQAVEIEALAGRQVIQDLLALTHALHHRADRVYWLSILRAPWCGLTLKDLHILAGGDHTNTVWSLMQNPPHLLSAEGQVRLQHLRTILLDAFAIQGQMGVSRWVRGTWLALNGPECLWNQEDVVDVQAFFSCLDQLDGSNQFSPERLDKEIEKLFAAPDAQGECLQMMTIHKSKGLQFDTVILPGLGEKVGGNHADKPLLLWEEVLVGRRMELLSAPYIPKWKHEKGVVTPYDYLETLEKERSENEAVRILYVAATRTERKLHLLGIVTQDGKGEANPTKNTPLHLLWSVLSEEDKYSVAQAESAPFEESRADLSAAFTPKLVRLNQMQIPAVLQREGSIPTVQIQDTVGVYADLEADIGVLTHRYMEIIGRSLTAAQGLEAWPLMRIHSLKPAMQYWLVQQGHTSVTAESAAQRVQDLLCHTLTGEAGRWLFKVRQQSAFELALTAMRDGRLRKYRIDSTFVEDNTRWIIDYKTTQFPTDVNPLVLKGKAEEYRSQLENYASLFDAQFPIRKAVLFLSVGQLIEV